MSKLRGKHVARWEGRWKKLRWDITTLQYKFLLDRLDETRTWGQDPSNCLEIDIHGSFFELENSTLFLHRWRNASPRRR